MQQPSLRMGPLSLAAADVAGRRPPARLSLAWCALKVFTARNL
jgi:hypothetical protein